MHDYYGFFKRGVKFSTQNHLEFLKSMEFIQDYPLKPLDDEFGMSLEQYLDNELVDDLNMNMMLLGWFTPIDEKNPGQNDIHKYLAILNEFIPNLTQEVLEILGDEYYVAQKCSRVENNQAILDKLIYSVFPGLYDVYCYERRYTQRLLCSLIIRCFCHASVITFKLSMIIKPFLRTQGYFAFRRPFCNRRFHTFVATFIVMARKLPADMLDDLITVEVVSTIQFFRVKYCGISKCNLLKELDIWCKLNDFDNMLMTKFGYWITLNNVYQMFDKDSITALSMLANFLGDKEEREKSQQPLLTTGILNRLDVLLGNPCHDENGLCVIRTFVNLFLSDASIENDAFSYLLKLLHGVLDMTIDYLRNLLTYEKYNREMYDDKPRHKEYYGYHSDADEFKTILMIYIDDIFTLLRLNQCLYVLNNNWYQWLNLANGTPVIDDTKIWKSFGEFYSSREINFCNRKLWFWIEDTYDITPYLPIIKQMVKICPVVMPIDVRKKLFPFSTKEIIREGEIFEISRDNVLSEIKEIFNDQKNIFEAPWNYIFKNEIAIGRGPTKELYAILSQTMAGQHELWNDKTSKLELPTLTERLDTSSFIGKLLAKVLYDGQSFYTPFANELFRRRTPMLGDHLIKEFYDIPITFPMMKDFLNQLILIKREIETIRSDDKLSHSEKHDLISNLKFQDGGSFEDLSLNFTLPGTETELIEGGNDILLTAFNIDEYLALLSNKRLQPSICYSYMMSAFEHYLPGVLGLYTPKELNLMICGQDVMRFTVKDLITKELFLVRNLLSKTSLRFLFEVLTTFDSEQMTMFLQFTTGRSSLPINGWAGLVPLLTFEKIIFDKPDEALPRAATCFNALLLPEYSSADVTKNKLLYAITEGRNSFQLV